MTTLETSPNDPASAHALDQADAALLLGLPRAEQRAQLGVAAQPPFFGADTWTAYELSWLNLRGKPQVALAHITVPCESPCTVDSTSLNRYLHSLANTRFADARDVRERIRADLNAVVGAGIGIQTRGPEMFAQEAVQELAGLSLDRLDVACMHYTPAAELLFAEFGQTPVEEVLTSKLLKSNCPVTGLPDWASVQIAYEGPAIDQEGLLQYLVSFRNHVGLPEHCVEQIFMDLWTRCQPARLSVHTRYTRRGGLDVNPFRTSHPQALPANMRTARQ